MPTILLARHGLHDEVGHVLSGRSAIGLNAQGQRQADALARRLDRDPPLAIWSSPRPRATETAHAVARRHGLEVMIAPALDEVDFGRFAGTGFADLDGDADWRAWNARRDTARCPGGETMGEAVARADAFLARLADAAGPILCVSHCDIIRGLVARRLGLGFDRMFGFDCDPGSLTALAIMPGGTRVVTLNERPPLDQIPADPSRSARSRSTAAITSVQSPVPA